LVKNIVIKAMLMKKLNHILQKYVPLRALSQELWTKEQFFLNVQPEKTFLMINAALERI